MPAVVDVVIIGAGFAGLAAAIRLQQQGRYSFVVFERAAAVGGTWRDNVYPGCGCDIPAPLYSYSFAPNPDWSRLYASQPEILAYIERLVAQFNLQPYLRFRSEISSTEFSEATGRWTLRTRDGQQVSARVVLSAIGPLNRPKVPALPGLASFAGHTFHSSQWDADYDLTGRRVAVIGTGASAVQFVPQIAPLVSQLFVFQRSAPWILPRRDRAFTDEERSRFRRWPLLQRWQRELIYWRNELFGLLFLGNQQLATQARALAERHLRRAIPDDAELRRRVTPTYALGCKRVLISNDYLPTLTRPHVQLVTEPLREVVPAGLVTQDGQLHAVDTIIFGTGFVASEFFIDLQVRGLGGRSLFGEWQQRSAEAYRGTTVSGFPNLLILVGPNTGLAHNSIIHIMESQVTYVLDYLRRLDQAGPGAWLDVKPEAQRQHNEQVQQQLAATVWASGCQSWYLTSAGKNTTLLPTLTPTFRRSLRKVRMHDYVVGRATTNVEAQQ